MSSNSNVDAGRYRRLVVVLVVAALLATAGCTSALPGGDGGDTGDASTDARVDLVPAQANALVYANAEGYRTDAVLAQLANATDEEAAEETGSDLEDFEEETGLDPAKLAAVTGFMDTNSTEDDAAMGSGVEDSDAYAGVVVSAAWAEEDVVAAMENESESEVSEESYAGYSLYTSDAEDTSGYVGVVDDTTYVLGNESAVKDSLDVAAGDADAVSGDVADAFEGTQDGYLRFAFAVPESELPTDDGGVGPGMGVNTDWANDLEVVSGAQYVEGDSVGASMTMTMGSESSASDATDVISGLVATYRGFTTDNTTKTLLSRDHLSIEKDGSSVDVTAEYPVDTLVTILEELDAGDVPQGGTLA